MKLYLAGPMSGFPIDFNFPTFFAATRWLRAKGYQVFSPAEADIERYGNMENIRSKANYKDCLRVDLNYIIDEAEGIALLPGWERSEGCAVEWALAKALKLPFIYLKQSDYEAYYSPLPREVISD